MIPDYEVSWEEDESTEEGNPVFVSLGDNVEELTELIITFKGRKETLKINFSIIYYEDSPTVNFDIVTPVVSVRWSNKSGQEILYE